MKFLEDGHIAMSWARQRCRSDNLGMPIVLPPDLFRAGGLALALVGDHLFVLDNVLSP